MDLQEFLAMGGTFTLSDDSHGVAHVATNYQRVPDFLDKAGIDNLVYLEKGSTTKDVRFPGVSAVSIKVTELREHSIFK